MKPSDVRRERDVTALNSTVCETDDFWMTVRHDGGVVLVEQRSGEKSIALITIPRRTFQKFLSWYSAEQT